MWFLLSSFLSPLLRGGERPLAMAANGGTIEPGLVGAIFPPTKGARASGILWYEQFTPAFLQENLRRRVRLEDNSR